MSARISVIIPTFNAEHTLERCLQTIVHQDYPNFEVLFIDALSTDNTLVIIKNYADQFPFIKYRSEKDNGIYDAMNKGVKICNGDWLYFLGSDDTLYDNKVLSAIAGEAIKTNDKVIYGNVIMRGKNQWNLDNVVFNGKYDLEKIININICHQAIFYHKSVFQLYGGYHPKYTTAADQEFNLRCYAATAFHYVDMIIANFFVGGQSTNRPDVRFNEDRGAIILKHFGKRIFNRSFINSRLYIQRAALSGTSGLNILNRLFCLLAYVKLKIQALYLTGPK